MHECTKTLRTERLFACQFPFCAIFDWRQKVFMALTSVLILGRRLNMAQWCSLLVISSALLLSTVAEGKGGKKGSLAVMVGGCSSVAVTSQGLCHAWGKSRQFHVGFAIVKPWQKWIEWDIRYTIYQWDLSLFRCWQVQWLFFKNCPHVQTSPKSMSKPPVILHVFQQLLMGHVFFFSFFLPKKHRGGLLEAKALMRWIWWVLCCFSSRNSVTPSCWPSRLGPTKTTGWSYHIFCIYSLYSLLNTYTHTHIYI